MNGEGIEQSLGFLFVVNQIVSHIPLVQFILIFHRISLQGGFGFTLINVSNLSL